MRINRLRQWSRPGLVCIGDAAHAMSPTGGVGINLAIQDAVAAANLLLRPLQEARVTDATLALVERRCEVPTRVTQASDIGPQGIRQGLPKPCTLEAALAIEVGAGNAWVNPVLGYIIGIGVRPDIPK